jgi:flagellar protein FlgJ
MYLKLKESGHPFPKMAAAQAGAESEYGMSALSRKANNTFGVKVRKGEKFKGVMMPTKEDYGQGQVDEVANFRTYDTVDANIKGYINFLNTGNYDKALNAKSDMEYLQELKNAGYATDQDYVTTVGSVYKRNLESGTFD